MFVQAIDSQAKALLAAQAALDKHAEDVVVMDLRGLSTVADFFIVCTAGSGPQISALQDHIDATLTQQQCPVAHTEGTLSSGTTSAVTRELQWVLMDCGEIVVHLFNRQARDFYRLEDLWADAPRVPLPAGSV